MPDKNQKDVEIVLRLFSLYTVWSNYEKPMLKYLNNKMDENKDFSSAVAKKFLIRFPEVTKLVAENLARPFRPSTVINSAMLEGIMVALLEDEEISSAGLKKGYNILSTDEVFVSVLRGATTDTLNVRKRIERAKKVLFDASR